MEISGQCLINAAQKVQQDPDAKKYWGSYMWICKKTNNFTKNIKIDAPLEDIRRAIDIIQTLAEQANRLNEPLSGRYWEQS